MTIKDLKTIIEEIIDNVYILKSKYISEPLEVIDYVGITFPENIYQQHLITFLEKQGSHIVYSDEWGSVYRLPNSIDTKYGELDLVKLSHIDGKKDRKPYADFKIDHDLYNHLNQKYKGKPGFVNLYGDGWEIIGVQDSNSPVSLFIPNIPLSFDLRNA